MHIHALSTDQPADWSTLKAALKKAEDELADLARTPARLAELLGSLDPAVHSLAWLYLM